MHIITVPVGIDVSKDSLEVFINRTGGQKRLTISNNVLGIEKFLGVLGDGSYTISLESTGRYESLVRHALEEKGHKVVVQNPRLAKRLIQGMGITAKNDAIDAEALAKTGQICKPTFPRSKVREQLGDISRMIAVHTKDRSAHKQRLQVPGLSAVAKQSLKRTIEFLNNEIKQLEKDFKVKIKTTELYRAYKLVQTVYAVGPATARVVVSEFNEDLSHWTRKQLSAYAGVVPIDNSSGKSVKQAHVSPHANKHLKAAFYMPAITLLGKDPASQQIYARLRAQGYNHQQAIVPIMHKLLRQVIAVHKRGSAWTAKPPVRA